MTGRNVITCPSCGKVNDAQSSPDDEEAVPEDGNLSMCLYCGDLSIFVTTDGVMGLRAPTLAEYEELMEDPEIRRMLAIRKVVMNEHEAESRQRD